MALSHTNKCDCPVGNCDCKSSIVSGSILYNPTTNEHIWIDHLLTFELGQLVTELWDPNNDGIIFISNEEWDTKEEFIPKKVWTPQEIAYFKARDETNALTNKKLCYKIIGVMGTSKYKEGVALSVVKSIAIIGTKHKLSDKQESVLRKFWIRHLIEKE